MSTPGFNHTVSWSNFRGLRSRPDNETEDAHCSAHFSTDYGYDNAEGDYTMRNIVVTITMNRHNSWVVNSAKTEALRKHEQGHFDITAIGAREIHDRMAFITGVSAGELASQKDELIAEVQVYINDANARYDEETEHGTNVTRQNSWEANIARVKGDVNGIISDLP